ncbi:MAG: hypothetical protein ACI9VR_001517 [Cognaticolwellia sp.]|jgi:hypothetical protein
MNYSYTNNSKQKRLPKLPADKARRSFRVRGAGHDSVVLGRINAVKRAMGITENRRDSVQVTRVDEKVKMVFKDGSLETYLHETR